MYGVWERSAVDGESGRADQMDRRDRVTDWAGLVRTFIVQVGLDGIQDGPRASERSLSGAQAEWTPGVSVDYAVGCLGESGGQTAQRNKDRAG